MAPSNLPRSQSFLATRREEQRFRITGANSRRRQAVLIGLDPRSCALVSDLVAAHPERRRAFDLGGRVSNGADEAHCLGGAASANTAAPGEAVTEANLVVAVAFAGATADMAATLAEVCLAQGLRPTVLVIHMARHDDGAASPMLKELRQSAAMIVIAESDAYVGDMLDALQA